MISESTIELSPTLFKKELNTIYAKSIPVRYMKYLFELSGEHPDLPIWEVEELLRCSGNVELIERDSTAAIFDADALPDQFTNRIALSHYLSEYIASVEFDHLTSAIESINLSEIESAAISIRIAEGKREDFNVTELTKEFGAILASKTKIDLIKPHTRFRIYIGDQAHIGKEIAKIDRGQYEKRKNRYLPFVSPISIHPRLARALINLTARSVNSKILDPFCGTGAILIEAAMMGMEAFGSDISDKMIEGSEVNLGNLKLSVHLEQMDVGKMGDFGEKFDCIVTDPPYGRSASTRREPIEQLYSRALVAFSENLVVNGRVGIVIPEIDTLDYEQDFKLLRKTSIRVHRSLTRNFVVLELR